MRSVPKDVAIIGAGLGGTALALALHQRSIPCRLYEARSENSDLIASGVVLAPNGCRILDALGVLGRIRPKCFQEEFNVVKNDKDETVEKILFGDEKLYPYKNHRLYRRVLYREMKAMLAERNIPILYDSRFEKIVNDTADGVTFQVGGKTEHAAILVGSDGIFSTVRSYLTPVVPEYSGLLSIYSHIPTANVRWPSEDFTQACTIQGKPGGLFMFPEVADGSDLLVGMQFAYPVRDREGWDALAADKEQLSVLFRKDYDLWHNTAKSVIDQVCAQTEMLLPWPFYQMPKLDTWSSSTGRVIIVGDAAHAMPPSSGQGVNQALEDVYTLAILLASLAQQADLRAALEFWQGWRQSRIDTMLENTMMTNIKRLPETERLKALQELKLKNPGNSLSLEDRIKKIYQQGVEQEMISWVQTQSKAEHSEIYLSSGRHVIHRLFLLRENLIPFIEINITSIVYVPIVGPGIIVSNIANIEGIEGI